MESRTTRWSRRYRAHRRGLNRDVGGNAYMPKSGLLPEKLTYYDAFMSIPINPFVNVGHRVPSNMLNSLLIRCYIPQWTIIGCSPLETKAPGGAAGAWEMPV